MGKATKILPSCLLTGPLAFTNVSVMRNDKHWKIECYGLVRALTPVTMSTKICWPPWGWMTTSDEETRLRNHLNSKGTGIYNGRHWKAGFIVISWLQQQQLFISSFWNQGSDMLSLRGSCDQPQAYRLAHSRCSQQVFTIYLHTWFLLCILF